MLNVKNKAVGNWYAIQACLGQVIAPAVFLNAGGGAGAGSVQSAITSSYNSITIEGSNPNNTIALSFQAGTDTTTPTTATLAQVVTPTSQGTQSNSVLYPTPDPTALSVQWSGVWNALAFGSSGTTILGEFGLNYLRNGNNNIMLRRVCVADGNFSPLTVINTLPLTVSILVANQ